MDAPLASAGPFKYQFHQIAIYTNDVEGAVAKMMELGYDNWTYDSATLTGMDRGVEDVKYGHMAFNYEMTPMELEFVCYTRPNGSSETYRHRNDMRDGSTPFISHMSTHVESIDAELVKMLDLGFTPYHLFETSEHQNPAIAGKKHFKEAIFDTTYILGYDIKLIERVFE